MYKGQILVIPKSGMIDEHMIQHKLWFMLKNIEKGMGVDDADAWSFIWVMIKFNKCVYDAAIMDKVKEMSQGLYV